MPTKFIDPLIDRMFYAIIDSRVTPRQVIFNPPATIVYWDDATKTVVKCREGEIFDEEKGFAMAYMKKIRGDDFHAYVRNALTNAKRYSNEEKTEEPTLCDLLEEVRKIVKELRFADKVVKTFTDNKTGSEKTYEERFNDITRDSLCVDCSSGVGLERHMGDLNGNDKRSK